MVFYSEFASLTHSQLMEKVRALQNLAYQLGVEEGTCVHVLGVNMCMCWEGRKVRRGMCWEWRKGWV